MKNNIFYFTGSGNSLKVGKDIGAKLGNAELIPIPKALKEGIDLNCERIGVVFPVYGYGVPRMVVDFLKRLKTNNYVFIIITYGGSGGCTLNQAKNILESVGTKLSAAFGVKMPDNYIPMFNPPSEEEQNKMFKEEEEVIKKVSTIVKNKENYYEENKISLIGRALSKGLYPIAIKNFKSSDKNFWVNEKCLKCSICYMVCPRKNIVMKEGKPTWHGDCEACMACIHWCPPKAIEYGKKSGNKRRYTHPKIKLEEMIINV
ncbi:EFR1 family ferrodoxin [Clostridium malenominatum]|uniref:EFR1 family ferrodoxin n=1 Tax=Clostridium malenominatum TaxID=1539 RepID=A0ABN1J5H0_9CLOT